jgi:hypothetical protein
VVYAVLTIVLLAPIVAFWFIGRARPARDRRDAVYGLLAVMAFMGLVVRGDWY